MRTITDINTTTVNTIIDNTTLVSTINTITNLPINIINDEQIPMMNRFRRIWIIKMSRNQSFCKK